MTVFKVDKPFEQDVWPVIKAFKSRKMNQFEHTDNSDRELKRVNMVEGWQEKYVLIPRLPEKAPQLENANPPDPAFIAYISLVDDRFHRDLRREAMERDVEHKTQQHKELHRKLDQLARTKAITQSIEFTKHVFSELKKEFTEQVDYNVDKRYEVREEWHKHQEQNVEQRIERQDESKSWHKWNYWHLRDYREDTDKIWEHKKEMDLAKLRLQNQKEEDLEQAQRPVYRREQMAFYNPSEIQLIFAAHQMAQNFLTHFNHVSAIDSPKFVTGESGVRTVILTSAIKSY